MRVKIHKALLVFLVGIMGLVSTTSFAEDDRQVIRDLWMQSNEAIKKHDADALKSFLAKDYVITISNGAIERSRDEHVESFASHFAQYPDVVYVRTPAKIIFSSAYLLAMEQGNWTGSRTTGNGNLENGGQYTAAWRKTGAGWKIYSELFVALYCNGEGCC